MTHKTSLSFEEAVEVWRLRERGYFQHQIAAVYGVNQRCVHEVLREKKHVGSKQAANIKKSA
jgi:hypothetical protein